MSEPDQKRIQIAPMAALNEAIALNEFYKNRVHLLANECHQLTEINEQLQSKIAEFELVAPSKDKGGKAN